MSNYIVAVDLGQVADYTAIAIIERVPPRPPEGWQTTINRVDPATAAVRAVANPYPGKPDYHVRHLERPPLGTKYTAVVARVQELLGTAPLDVRTTPLVIDRTGVGRGVFDLFKGAGMQPRGITITGGESVSQDADDPLHTRVPKRDLAGCLVALVQGERLKIAGGLAEGPTLVNEQLHFKVKIHLATGNDTYESWRESIHDDLVLAVAMGCWWGEHRPPVPAPFVGPPRRPFTVR